MPGNAADAAYEARRKERLRGIMSQMEGEIAAEEAAAAPAPVAEDEDLWSERPERGDVLKKRAETMGVYGALKAINDGGGDPTVSSADVNRAFIKQSGRELQMAGKNIADTVPAIGTSWQKMGSDLNAFYLENPGLIPRVPQEFRAPQEVIEDFILSNEVFRAIPVVGDSFGPASKEEREAKIAESREKSAGLEEKMREQLPEGENAIQQGVVDTTLNLGMMLPSLAASVVTKNPNVGLAMMGTQTGATSYGDARRAGADPTKAYRYGIMMGAVEAATERLPLKYLVGDIGKKTPFLETLKKQLISDGLGEQAATHIQDMLTWVELNPEKTFADYIEERPEAIQRTAITSAMMSLVMTGGQQGISQLAGKDEAPAPESEGGAGEVAEAPAPEAPENSETPPQPQPNEEDQAETSPDPDKLAEVEAISEVIEQAEPAQQPTAREESDAFVAEYEAALGITPEFEDLAESQPDPGEGGLGRTFESLVEENAEPRPEATSFRDQFGADRPETPIETKAIDEIEAATPEATSFRSYFGRKSFGGEGLESAPEAANEDVDTTLLSDDEVSAIADNEVLATPEAADAESMLEIAEQNYDEVLSDDILTGLDDQFDMPAEEVREIMDGAIEGQGSTKKFNTLMKRVDKVRRSGVKAARGDKLSDFDKEMNARRRQLHRVALNTFGEWYLELAKSGRVGFASNMQDVLPGVPEDTMAMAMPDGKVVISDQIDPRDFEGLFLHEVGIHAGLQGLIGASGKEAILAEVDRLAETGERFASVARQWARQMAFRPEHAREETLAYLVQFAPAAPIVTRAIASMKVWIARRFPGLIPRLGWKTADFRQLALLSIRNQAYKALEMPVSFRSGLDSDHTTLVLDRPHKSRPPILNPKYRKWPYSQFGEPEPLLLDQTRTTINLEDVGNFRQNVINNEEVLTDPHTLEAMFQAHTDFDVFGYQDLIETVKASDDPDAAYELSAMLEPLKGMDAPLDIQYARGDGFLRPIGFNDDLDRGTDTFFDPRLNEAQNKAVEMARNRFSNAEIAEELEWDGQSVSNALSRARSMGIDVPHGSRGAAGMDRLYMEELIEVGFSNEVIAQRTGKTRNHVKQVRHQVKNGDIKRLPMQTEVRMQRARDLGWNTERQVYHGTPGEIEGDALRTSPDGLLGRGVYLTTATDQANTYAGEDGGAVLPLFIRGELATLDQLKEAQKRAAAGIGNVMNAQRKIAELAQHYLQQAGYTGVEAGTTIAMFDFSDVRSVNARFDPMRDSQSGFMLSRGGAALAQDLPGSPQWEAAKAKGLDMSPEGRMQRAKKMGYETDTVLYHGTANGGFDQFDAYAGSGYGLFGTGVYLTEDPQVASTYTNKGVTRMERRGETPAQTVYPVYVRLKDPVDMDAPADLARWTKGLSVYGYDLQLLEEYGLDSGSNPTNEDLFRLLEEVIIDEHIPQYEGAERMQDILMEMGHDGVRHVGGGRVQKDGARHNVTIAFNAEDIRSVNAAFDPDASSSPNIMLSRGGQKDDMFDPYAEKDVYVNLARVAGPEDFKALIQKLANEARPEVKERVGGRRPLAQVEREAANEEAFKALAKRRRGNILNDKEMLALRQLRDSSANKIRELAELYQQNPSLAAKAALHRAMVLHRTIQAEVSGASADAARLLGSLRILSKDSTTRRMAMEDALARWDNDENVDDLVKRIARLGPNQQVELDDLVRVSMKQAWTDLGGAWIRAMFLSNPKTHIVNATGNMAVMAMDVGSTYFGGALTMDQQMISEAGVRASELMDAFYYQMRYMAQHSQMNPTKPNVSLRFDDMGVNGRQVDAGSERALSAGRVSALTGGLASNPSEDSIAGHTINLIGYGIAAPSEALGVADDMFKGINYRVEMRALALRQANAEARDGRIDKDQVSMRIEELLADPSDEMIQTARHAAQERTFTNRPGPLTMGVLRFRRALNNVTGLPLGHLLLPFVITPSNIFSYTFRHLPSAAFFPEWRADYAAGGQRRARAVGQVAMGTSVMMLGMGLASAGIMNGSGPDDIEKKRELQGLAGAGFQPFALNIDGHSYTIDRLDPVSSMLLIGAELNEIWANKGWDSEPDDELGDLLTSSVLNIGRMMLDKSYMTGLRDFVRALEDPYYRERYFARTAAAVTTPALSAEIRRQTDPFWREADTAIASIKNRIPTMSETLPQEYDLFGRPKVYQSGHGVVYDSLMPFIAKKVDPSPIDTELMRLHYLPSTMDRSIGVPVGPQSMQVSLREHPEIYSRMSQLMGGDKDLKIPSVLDRLNELVESDGYAKLMDGPDPLRGSKARAIQDVLADHRERVRQIVVTEYWGDLQQLGREELKRSLARAAEQEEERQSEMAAALAEAVAQGE